MSLSQQRGYTLLEVLCVLSIGLILWLIAMPSYREFIYQIRTQTVVTHFVQLLNFARLSSIKLGKPVSICATQDGKNCHAGWQGSFIVFIDETRSGKLAQPNDLLRSWTLNKGQGRISWQASQHYLTMQPNGISPSNAGTFYYCPRDNNLEYARAIVINLAGRVKVLDNSSYNLLNCD